MGSGDTKCNLKNNRHTKIHSQQSHNHRSHSHSHSHNHSHSHELEHEHEHDKKASWCQCSDVMRLIFMIAMIFSFFLVEITVGYISKSIALINDSFHMLSDSLALFVALGAAIVGYFFSWIFFLFSISFLLFWMHSYFSWLCIYFLIFRYPNATSQLLSDASKCLAHWSIQFFWSRYALVYLLRR